MARPALKVLHTSDVHLGALTGPTAVEPDRCLASFRAVVDLALAERVDLVLIVGDFFDHHRVSERVVDFTREQLLRLSMPTIILPGNHDPLTEDSPYWRLDLERAPNVRLIRERAGETVRLPDLDLAIWGRPHCSYEENVLPLRGVPPRGPETWQIALAHGQYVRSDADRRRSYPILPEELAACGRDYVAMGHVDRHDVVLREPVVGCYSGSPTWTGLSALVHLRQEDGVRHVEVEAVEVRPLSRA